MENTTSDLLLPLGAFLVAVFLRLSPYTRRFIWPLSLFAVLIHELCHGLAALVTGGAFERFAMEGQGGVAYTRGGWRWLVISAGYVGTAIFGAVLLVLANRVEEPGIIAIGLGAIFALLTLLFSGMGLHKLHILELVVAIIVVSGGATIFFTAHTSILQSAGLVIGALGILLFVRFISDEFFFTVAVGLLSSAALIVIGYYGLNDHPASARFILNFLAFMVGLNAIYDSWYLFTLITDPATKRTDDASRMAQEVGFPARFWAVAWSLNAIFMLGFAVTVTFVVL